MVRHRSIIDSSQPVLLMMWMDVTSAKLNETLEHKVFNLPIAVRGLADLSEIIPAAHKYCFTLVGSYNKLKERTDRYLVVK